MSSVVISGDTSGTITLQAPAVSGSTTLTLPATTATLATLTTPSFASTIGVGGATASASGSGISFPATQSASSDANTLDDYEEGTWTPTGGGLTNNVTAYYTKVGRLVQAICDVTFPGGGAATQAQINGLPFTNLTPGGGGSIGYTTYTSAITLNIERSTTYFVFVSFGGANLTFANLNGVRLIVTLVYSV